MVCHMESNNNSGSNVEEKNSSKDPVLEVRNLKKTFASGATVAVKDLSFAVYRGEILSILGPSGCGKTTTLRMVAGLEHPDKGNILVNGLSVIGSKPHKRDVGLMFQDLALFPHKTVTANVAFGLRIQGIGKSEIAERVKEMLEVVELPFKTFGSRYPAELSGGQRQRVALARTLVVRPAVILFDEPLSGLDRRLRDSMAIELRRLQKRLGVTSVYVTHDQETASTMSDRIIIMQAGDIAQSGEPVEIYNHPNSRFVSNFLGDMNFLEGISALGPDNVTYVKMLGGSVLTSGNTIKHNKKLTVGVRPEHIRLSLVKSENTICQVRIEEASFSSGIFTYKVKTSEGIMLTARTMTDYFSKGAEVFLGLERDCIQVIEVG